MHKRLVVVLVVLGLFAACGFKNRSGYYYDNHRFNYVKLERFKDVGSRNLTHPYNFTEQQVRAILGSIEIDKGIIFSKRVKQKRMFDKYSINKLSPYIVKAFSEADAQQKVGIAFLIKAPKFVLRNDRLSVGSMWVEEGKLHIDFEVIYAKLTGDYDKRGSYSVKRANMAKGLRITFNLKPGQEYGDSITELVIDPAMYSTFATDEAAEEKVPVIVKAGRETKQTQPVGERSTQERLKELKVLRDEKVITDEEYKKKRKEILEQL